MQVFTDHGRRNSGSRSFVCIASRERNTLMSYDHLVLHLALLQQTCTAAFMAMLAVLGSSSRSTPRSLPRTPRESTRPPCLRTWETFPRRGDRDRRSHRAGTVVDSCLDVDRSWLDRSCQVKNQCPVGFALAHAVSLFFGYLMEGDPMQLGLCRHLFAKKTPKLISPTNSTTNQPRQTYGSLE